MVGVSDEEWWAWWKERGAMGPDPDPNSPVAGMHIWGWMNPVELTWLRGRASEMDSVCEIGVLHGRSAFALLTGCPGPVYCIDPWDDERDMCYSSFMGSCGHFPNLRAVRGYSPAAGGEVPDIDMCFIDGNHDEASIRADASYWVGKTRKLLCGHDYYDTDEWSVKSVVDEFFGDAVRVADGTAIWYVEI